MSRFIAFATLLVLSFSSGTILAAQGTVTGKEPEGWDTGAFNVVLGTLIDVQKDGPAELNRYRATLVPLATLAGAFDPSLHPKVPVRFYVGRASSSIEQPPPSGATVIAVIVVGTLQADETEPSNWIRSDICAFMPGESAMVVVKGLGDARVAETLKKLQEARAHPNPDPNRQPAKSGPR
jgi:hypothetical protein